MSHFINTNLDVDFDTLVACYCSSEFFSKKSRKIVTKINF